MKTAKTYPKLKFESNVYINLSYSYLKILRHVLSHNLAFQI